MVELQSLLRRRVHAIILVQCAVRGRQAYILVDRLKKIKFVKKMRAKRIQRAFRGWRTRMRILMEYLRENTGSKVELDDTRHLSYLIYYLLLKRRRREHKYRVLNVSAVYTQKIVRGFLGRRVARGVWRLVESLKGWANPQYAKAFMRQLLRNKIFLSIPVKVSREETPAVEHVRKFLPLDCRTDIEASVYVYSAALKAWYDSSDSPLLKSELSALIACFRNPQTSGINISVVDAYITMHAAPCKTHGRKICAECYFFQDCRWSRCRSQRYVSND